MKNDENYLSDANKSQQKNQNINENVSQLSQSDYLLQGAKKDKEFYHLARTKLMDIYKDIRLNPSKQGCGFSQKPVGCRRLQLGNLSAVGSSLAKMPKFKKIFYDLSKNFSLRAFGAQKKNLHALGARNLKNFFVPSVGKFKNFFSRRRRENLKVFFSKIFVRLR